MKLFHSIPKPTRYVVISIVTAAVIVMGGLTLRSGVLKATSATPDVMLNDMRSPIANENTSITSNKPDTSPDASGIIRGKVPTPLPVPNPETITVLPDTSAYPQEDLTNKQPSPIAVTPDRPPEAAYGHLPYTERSANLVSIGAFIRENYEREETLDAEAAQAFAYMQTAAAIQNVRLIPISGFRNIVDQDQLFENQTQRKGSRTVAAQFSAPPGHSEHHTGYAIDIGDADQPETDIKYGFEETEAYRWLLQNASIYGFEQSFPKNNQQGVTFEPWHWRFAGSERAAQVFAPAHRYFPSQQKALP